MRITSAVLLLSVCVLLLSGPTVSTVSLNVRPNRQQFFRDKSVSLSCEEEEESSAGWRVKRRRGSQTEECGGFGSADGSSCNITDMFPSESGVYWCERSGERSEEVTINVTEGNVILEVPALPVMEGSDVTLHCRAKDDSIIEAYFYRNKTLIQIEPAAGFTISPVQQSDEGFYSCQVDLTGASAESWLSVRARPPPPSTPPTSPPSPISNSSSPDPGSTPSSQSSQVSVPIVLGVVLSVVLLVLLLIGGLLLQKKQSGRGSSSSSPPEEVTYADVTIKQPTNKREPGGGDDVTYADVKHQKKKRSRRREAGVDPLYSDVKVRSGPADITYGEVVVRPQKTSKNKTVQPSDPDVVYSSVRAGQSAVLAAGLCSGSGSRRRFTSRDQQTERSCRPN